MSEFTTMENLQCQVSAQFGAVLKYGNKVIVTDYSYNRDYCAEIYDFIDVPGESGLGDIECRIALVQKEIGFEDNGHAVAWALEQI